MTLDVVPGETHALGLLKAASPLSVVITERECSRTNLMMPAGETHGSVSYPFVNHALQWLAASLDGRAAG